MRYEKGNNMLFTDYYLKHIENYLDEDDFMFLRKKSIMITGATGMIGSALVDMLMLANQKYHLELCVYAIGRSNERADKRFAQFDYKKNEFIFIEHDIINPFDKKIKADFIVHAASNAYPAVFAKYPVETMLSNFYGTYYLLEKARQWEAAFLFISSGEIYGELTKDIKNEDDYGFVDSMNVRSCYPNSKRAAETLCVSYAYEYGARTLVARPSHVYGPTMTESDNRASSEFIRAGVLKKDIIMNSAGMILRSYTYVFDACLGILKILENGISANAYNIADENKAVYIRDFAEFVAKDAKVDVIKQVNKAYVGATNISRQVMSGVKLKQLGWKCKYNVAEGIKETLLCLEQS